MQGKRMLEGYRALDLTDETGFLCGKILAELGMDVIKVEKPGGDPARMTGPFWHDQANPEKSLYWFAYNSSKRGVTLDIQKEAGKQIFRALVRTADFVIESFAPGNLDRLGFGYSELRRIKEDIILTSITAFGQTGPYRDYRGGRLVNNALAGYTYLNGDPKREPLTGGGDQPAYQGGLNAYVGVMAALLMRQRTGRGQHIDLSQAESAVCLIGETALGYALNGKIPLRMGNRHPVHAPQGCYRCQGEDQWVAMAVSSEKEWEALCRVLEHPEWIKEERFSDPANRRKNQEELDELIEVWTGRQKHLEAMGRLQEAGVPAGAVLDAAELLADEHLRARGFFREINHPEVGPRKYCGLPIRFSEASMPSPRPAPCLGEHNEYVLGKLLGLSRDEITKLEEENIIGTRPID